MTKKIVTLSAINRKNNMAVKSIVKETITNPVWWREMTMITIGCVMAAVGFVFFINPYNIVPGGIYGLGIV